MKARPSHEDLSLIRMPEVSRRMGRHSSRIYEDIRIGLMTKPVKLSNQSSGWPQYEIDTIAKCRIAGVDDDELRAMVTKLHAFRQLMYEEACAALVA